MIDIKTVPLYGKKAAGRVALVDDEDHDLVMRYRWNVIEGNRGRNPHGPYAFTSTRYPDGRRGTIMMHNLITGIKGIDHVNHNGLDNRRSNLRVATGTQNQGNRRGKANGTSQYKGVYLEKRTLRWVAELGARGDDRKKWLGSYVLEEDAALAYDAAARQAYGEFACLNFPGPGESGARDTGNVDATAGEMPDGRQPRGWGTSAYVGVMWDKNKRKWLAKISAGGRVRHLGLYASEIEGALAYDSAARESYGEKATLNFPSGLTSELADLMHAQKESGNAEAAATKQRVSAAAAERWTHREPVQRVCEVCGGEYLTRAVRATKYCSQRCNDKARNRRGRRPRSRRRAMATAVTSGESG